MRDPWGRPPPISLTWLIVTALLAGIGLSFALIGNLGAHDGPYEPPQCEAECTAGSRGR